MPDSKIKIFYSYSHKDERLRNKLETHLKTLKRKGLIEEWHDRKIKAGDEGDSEIDVHIETSDIILLLVSADFIASDYCYNKELRRALTRHKSGQARVIPIILRPVQWLDTPFAKLQVLPKDGKPITTWKNKDTAWLDVIDGISEVVGQQLARESQQISDIAPVSFRRLLKEEFERLEKSHQRKDNLNGFSTGFHDFDKIIDGIHRKDVIVIAGHPAMGKIDLTLAIGATAAIHHNLSVLFFSTRLEKEHIVRRILSGESDIPLVRINRGKPEAREWPRLAEAGGRLSDIPLTIHDKVPLTIQELEELVRREAKMKGLGFLIIDGIENIANTASDTMKGIEPITITRKIKSISRTFDIPIIVTLNIGNSSDKRGDQRPRLKDLGEWETATTATANVVLFLYRDEVYHPDREEKRGIAEIIVAKNDYGSTQAIVLAYIESLHTFRNLYYRE